MLAHYLKPYWRSLLGNFVSLSLGIGGLGLGIAVFVLCLLFVQTELTFDGFNTNKKSIYRIVLGPGDGEGSAYTSHIIGQTASENFPGVQWITFSNAGNARISFFNGERRFTESRFYFTSPQLFDVFSFRLRVGDPSTCLAAPFSVVMTPAAASRYFGDEEAVGKSIKVDWAGTIYDLAVTGLMEPPPANSHLQFDFLVSYATAEQIFLPKTIFTDWTANFQYNYLRLAEGVSPDVVEKALQKTYAASVSAEQRTHNVRLQPLKRIHLYSKLAAEHSRNGDLMYVYLAASLAFLIIVVSVVNYLNILLAIYARRLREMGIRSVLGASRQQIGTQFTFESMLNLTAALAISCLFIVVSAPFFSSLLNSKLLFTSVLAHPWIPTVCLAIIAVFISACAILFISAVKPVSVVGSNSAFLAGGRMQSLLVGLQVSISLILIAGSISINRQLHFMEDRNLGFEKEDIVVVPYGRLITRELERSRAEFLNTPDIANLALSSQVPASSLNFKVRCFPSGGNPMKSSDPWLVSMLVVDKSFIDTYGLKMSEGRAFTDDIRSDTSEAFVVNEAFVNELGWNDAVGSTLEINFNPGTGLPVTKRGRVVGIVKDFHFESLHKPITPVIFTYLPTAFFYASFRLTPGQTDEKIARLRAKWSVLFPDTPFDYFFLSDRLDAVYRTERSWSSSVDIFSTAAVLISCFGIYGLLSVMLQRRTKEITIRKVMGASQTSIAVMLSSSIFQVIVLAFVVALPLSFYAIDSWLDTFAYRVPFGIDVFIISFLSFAVIVLLVISRKLLKGARTSVVQNLRNE